MQPQMCNLAGCLTLHLTMADSLFSSDLISKDVIAQLPEGYTLRPLERNDFALGFLDVLRALTTVGDIKQEEYERYKAKWWNVKEVISTEEFIEERHRVGMSLPACNALRTVKCSYILSRNRLPADGSHTAAVQHANRRD